MWLKFPSFSIIVTRTECSYVINEQMETWNNLKQLKTNGNETTWSNLNQIETWNNLKQIETWNNKWNLKQMETSGNRQ